MSPIQRFSVLVGTMFEFVAIRRTKFRRKTFENSKKRRCQRRFVNIEYVRRERKKSFIRTSRTLNPKRNTISFYFWHVQRSHSNRIFQQNNSLGHSVLPNISPSDFIIICAFDFRVLLPRPLFRWVFARLHYSLYTRGGNSADVNDIDKGRFAP